MTAEPAAATATKSETERKAEDMDAIREQELTRMPDPAPPDAEAMHAQSAEYIEPAIDPQWMDAWKMFPDEDGEYGVPVKVPRGQWDGAGANSLNKLRRPDGAFWFRVSTPERTQPEAQFECFVGECKKRVHKRIQVVDHVRAFHHSEARAHKEILERIERQVAAEDPRLQRLLADLELDESGDPAPESPVPEAAPIEDRCHTCGEAIIAGNWGDHVCGGGA